MLEKLDKELLKGDDRAALALVKDLQGKPDGLRCFGAARQVSECNNFEASVSSFRVSGNSSTIDSKTNQFWEKFL